MTTLALDTVVRWRPGAIRPARLAALASLSLLVIVGVELAVLAAVLPETLEMWWTADRMGDFANFYDDAANLNINGLYSPGLSLVMHPLSWMHVHNAYRVYVGLGMLAVLAIAFIAQRNVNSIEGKLAVALGIISLPQMHWALRLGHMTSMLALSALGGFLLLKRHPILAGLCFAVLVLKPQYAAVPGLYLLWTRNGRALAAMVAGTLVLEVAGFAAVGFSNVGPYISSFFDLSADARDNLLPYQQSWQYAWQGFLISSGIEPIPMLALVLSFLSLGVVVVAWAQGVRSVAMAAAALGMLIVTPYANFYDWGILAVAAVLLLRTDLKWSILIPVILIGFYAAMLASQHATPFPAVDVQVGVVEADGSISVLPASFISPTNGIYWITPLVLAVVGLLALAVNRNGREEGAAAPEAAAALEAPAVGGPTLSADANAERSATPVRLRPLAAFALAAVVISASFFTSAYLGHAPPFTQTYDPFGPSEVLKVVPDDFPLPQGSRLRDAGEGDPLPYHIEWTSTEPVAAISPLYEELLTTEPWELMLAESEGDSYGIRLGRFTSFGFMTHWGILDVSPADEGSVITLDLFVTQLISVSEAAPSKDE